MNCKPGDLAYIVGAKKSPDLNGRIVRVVRRVVPGEVLDMGGGGLLRLRYDRLHDWVIEANLPLPYRSPARGLQQVLRRPIGDRYLRPIRDQDGEDETLEWAGKPQEQPCNAL